MSFADTARALQLDVLAMLHEGAETIVLLGPHEPGFWARFSASKEYADKGPHPLDRWSKRVIGSLAAEWGGTAIYPSDGPPYPPFIAWALASGQIWTSPVGLLVHGRAGLMVSFRGAIRIAGRLPLPPQGDTPCQSCADQPCSSACPVGALRPNAYDTDACHSHLDSIARQACMSQGCAARRACPVSATYGRVSEQSAFHMRAFHKP